jgi:hypothetical protein
MDGGLRHADGSSANEFVRAVSSGFVGIETNAPNATLQVSGTARVDNRETWTE